MITTHAQPTLPHSPISVWFHYDATRRRVKVRKVLYAGRPVRVKQIGEPALERRRGMEKRVYHCRTEGGASLVLAMDRESLAWTCEEIRNFQGDLVE